MKKVLVTIMAGVMATLVMTGCGNGSEKTKKDNDGVNEITVNEIHVEEIQVEEIQIEEIQTEEIRTERVYIDDEYNNERNYNNRVNTWDNCDIQSWD